MTGLESMRLVEPLSMSSAGPGAQGRSVRGRTESTVFQVIEEIITHMIEAVSLYKWILSLTRFIPAEKIFAGFSANHS